MKSTHRRNRLALGIFCLASFQSLPLNAQAAGSDSTGQCSLAIVSKLMATRAKICDAAAVIELAHTGHVYQQNQLGMASILAIGPDLGARDALSWFEKAAMKGYAPAQVNLAVMYANGWGIPKNYGAALEWLKLASDQHCARADYNLGVLYMQGTGVRQDYGEARRWFKRAAEGGDTSAQTNLAYLYDQGLGVTRNALIAVSWYQKAARAGNLLGEYDLGDMYLRGEGVAQSNFEAFSWFTKAAEQGHTGAFIKLAYMYANGMGTKPDPEYAYSLITAASLAGDHRGDELLPALERALSPKQITAAKARAAGMRSWSPSVKAAPALVP